MRSLVMVVLLVACSSPNKPVEQAPPPPPPSVDAAPLPADAAPVATVAKTADGGACKAADDCASGMCEGKGCGDDALGTCVAADRACTKDLRQYCGCDGVTFGASGSCPNKRFASLGACAPVKKADGAQCFAGDECSSGTCEGQGCGDTEPGTCMPTARRCTRDLRAYCGCDGKTFRGSGTCPGQRYQAKEACTTAKTNRAEGAFCLKASECASGVCEGEGCTDDKPGRCVGKVQACTQATVTYCGCDGKTKFSSNGCLGVRYKSRAGGCEAS